MGFVPPRKPDRPDRIHSDSWRRFLACESRTILRMEVRCQAAMAKSAWRLLMAIALIGVLWRYGWD